MRLAVALLAVAIVVAAAGKQAEISELLEVEDNQAERQDDPVIRQVSTTPAPSDSRPVDCADILMAGTKTSGVYEIYPFTCTCTQRQPVRVWCDMDTDGGGWTVFLYRHLSSTAVRTGLDFNRTWEEYKNGFGDVYGEHWLGNELLHVMTHGRSYSMRMDMQLDSGSHEYATYHTVRVSDENSRYQFLGAGSILGPTNSRYCFTYMSGRYFTTVDRDNEYYYTGNCAAKQGGGFWYYNCKYFNPTSAPVNETLEITCYKNPTFEAMQIQLKIRPTLCEGTVKIIHLNGGQCGCNNQ